MLFRQKFIEAARRGRADDRTDAAHVSRNVTSYGMSKTARIRSPRLPFAGVEAAAAAVVVAVARYWDQIRSLRSGAIVTVIPGSYIGYYEPHVE